RSILPQDILYLDQAADDTSCNIIFSFSISCGAATYLTLSLHRTRWSSQGAEGRVEIFRQEDTTRSLIE
ncbi:hypothetical protein, partial [[Clostridium] innocuum]|uniref:hypothetical protein n=1 Tax=Clostridium innocuum TaxID=1522 RepID=UPI001C7052E4